MKITTVFIACLICTFGMAQTVKKKVEQKASQRLDTKIDQTIDKGLNKVEETIDSLFKKKTKKKNSKDSSILKRTNGPGTSSSETKKENQGNAPTQPTVTSFSDFVPGTSVIFEDHFEKDAPGDFPAQWNTNGSGKIVTIDGVPGKWLDVQHNSIVNPVMDKALPENCTIEFDLFLSAEGEQRIPTIHFGLTPVRDILKEDIYYKEKFFVNIFRYAEKDGQGVEYGLREVIGNKNDFPLTNYINKVLHVSMAINKTRIRVYLDQSKLIDLPRALTADMRNNFFLNNGYVIPASELGMLLSNVRIATAETDARSLLIKDLMEKGKAVTNDILFDVNSDVIKPESYSVINQFGEALKDNPELKIKITGHTDSDGADASNLVLSQKRAASVKRYILENYGIAQNRLTTDGKGASVPVASNTTTEGKAKNRRVEFIKL